MKFESHSGEKIEMVQLYITQTYLSIMLGKNEVANEFLLNDVKQNFIPEEWHKHPFVFLCQDSYLNQMSDKLPETTCVALLVGYGGTSNSKDVPLVVIWFQNEFFNSPPENIVEAILSLDWSEFESDYPYFS